MCIYYKTAEKYRLLPYKSEYKKGLITIILAFTYLLAFTANNSAKATNLTTMQVVSFSGRLIEKESEKPVEMATIVLTEMNKWDVTNENGEFVINNIEQGTHTLYVSCLGYKPIEKIITIEGNIVNYIIKLEISSLALDEVTVTAKESKIASISKIGQVAIQHIQPKSIGDVLQLLPGHITENPSLSNPGQIKIREVGFQRGGKVYTDSKDVTSALGAAIIIDGVPLSNNSNMQVFSTAKSGRSSRTPSVAGRGIDLRGISTDNIESIEVIRGIPSVEYGDLTSGAVIINTKTGKTPYEVKFMLDPQTKILFLGKGFSLSNKGIINANIDFTQSYSDIRRKYTGYERLTTNLKYTNTFFKNNKPLTFNLKLAYFSTIDEEKTDPQLKRNEEITASSEGIRAGLNGKWYLNKKLLTNLFYNFSVNYSHQSDFSKRVHTITAGAMPLATSFYSGEHEADFLPAEYYSELSIDGKPYNIFAQIKGNISTKTSGIFNNVLFGIEWRTSGNSGNGRSFDLNYPPSINSTSTIRPRSFKDIPALNTFTLFIEDKIIALLGTTTFTGQAGVRYSNVQPKGFINTRGTTSLEPRLNFKYQILDKKNNNIFNNLSLRFGYGIAAKTPTLLHLHPDKAYFDETSLNYKDEQNLDGSLAVLTTKIIDDTSNPDLKPAINRKTEAGIDFSIRQISANITGYSEKQTGGFSFRRNSIFFEHREYQLTGGGLFPYFIEGEGVFYNDGGNAIRAPYSMDTSFHFYRTPINNYTLKKRGIEYVLNMGKSKSLKTSFIINGAWMHTESFNTEKSYSSVLTGYQGRAFPYIMVFPAGEKTTRQRFSTTIRTITHIPSVRMVFSLATQIIWFEKRQYFYENENGIPYVYVTRDKERIDVDNVYSYTGEGIRKNVAPVGYIDKEGNYYDWNPDNYLTPPYYKMVRTYHDFYFLPEIYPVAFQFNIKLTKEFTNNLTLAFTANNFLNIRPYHKLKRTAGYIQRNTPLYFGAELKLRI